MIYGKDLYDWFTKRGYGEDNNYVQSGVLPAEDGEEYEMTGSVTEKKVLETLDGGKGKKDSARKPIKLPADVYERYFAGVKPADMAGIVEEALAAWFGKGGDADVPDGRDREAG